MTTAQKLGNDDYQALQLALQDSMGIVIGEESRGQIEGRLRPIMSRERLSRLSELAKVLRDDKAARIRSEVLDAITMHSSRWFMHDDIHRLFADYILPSLIDKQANECRIWYPCCGFGQGAYSLAMTIDRARADLGSEIAVEIVATDASQDALDVAAACMFHEGELDGLPESFRQRYLVQEGEDYKVDENICKMLHFKQCDLLSEALDLGRFDVIVSPDVLMYFSTGLKRQILDDYATLLDASGILLLNSGEMVQPFSDRFEMVEHEIATFYRQFG